jgi:hypothetical protein
VIVVKTPILGNLDLRAHGVVERRKTEYRLLSDKSTAIAHPLPRAGRDPSTSCVGPIHQLGKKEPFQKAEFRSNFCRYSSMSLPAPNVGSPAGSAASN